MKDPWTEPMGGGIEGGRWVWVGQRKVVVGTWRQLYLDTNKKRGRSATRSTPISKGSGFGQKQ